MNVAEFQDNCQKHSQAFITSTSYTLRCMGWRRSHTTRSFLQPMAGGSTFWEFSCSGALQEFLVPLQTASESLTFCQRLLERKLRSTMQYRHIQACRTIGHKWAGSIWTQGHMRKLQERSLAGRSPTYSNIDNEPKEIGTATSTRRCHTGLSFR